MAQTVLVVKFTITKGVSDATMHIGDTRIFPDDSGYAIVSDGVHSSTIHFESRNEIALYGCTFVKGDDDAEYEPWSMVSDSKNPYYDALKEIYDRVGITLEQKSELMMQALGLTDTVRKWYGAVPIDYQDKTKGRNWTNPDTGEVEFLSYDTYGVETDSYETNYALCYVGPMNGWYYEQ